MKHTWLAPLLLAGVAGCSAPVPVGDCALEAIQLPDSVTLDQVTRVEAAGGDPVHCKVAGTIDGTIGFELLLPLPLEWNGRFLMGGGGAFVGSPRNQSLSPPFSSLHKGYATIGTDTGHRGSAIRADWALNDPVAEENFAHRAVHRTTVVGKQITSAYYQDEIARSYFVGCSRGGGQALIEAQRYPEDYDGIVAAAPWMNFPGSIAAALQNTRAMYPDSGDLSSPVVTVDNRVLLEREILAACDADDGLADGIVADPRSCGFDPARLPRCPAGQPGADCLTAAQLAAILTVYRGPSIDGRSLGFGFPFGGENDEHAWADWITGSRDQIAPGVPSLQMVLGVQFARYLVYDDPEWDYASYDFADWRRDTEEIGLLLNGDDPELSRFRDAGGKLILWHGWSDAALSALQSIEYYEQALAHDPLSDEYFRLFLLPGVGHCGFGPGASVIDWIELIERWVEQDLPPETPVAARVEGGEVRFTRPVCAYPTTMRYVGGDPDEASSFRCE